MERLTWTDKDDGVFVDGTDCYELNLDEFVTVYSGEAVVKLSRYEDTGMTPDEIIQMKNAIKKFFKDFPDASNILEATNDMPGSAFK